MRILTAFAVIATSLYSQVPPTAREQALGKAMARDVERREHLVEDPQVVDYVTAIVHKLAKPCQAGDVNVRVIESDAINGSALPGEQLFVTTGMLRFVENESELAGVLAHLIRRVPLRGPQPTADSPLVFIGGPNGDTFLPTPDTVIPRNLE